MTVAVDPSVRYRVWRAVSGEEWRWSWSDLATRTPLYAIIDALFPLERFLDIVPEEL